MSVTVMAAVFAHSRSKGTTRLVLLALADTAAEDGEVTAYARSQMILRRKANASKSAVSRAIDNLVELGELEVLILGDGRRSTDYRIRMDRLTAEGSQDDAPPIDTPRVADRHPTGSETTPVGCHPAAPIPPSSPVVAPSVPIPADRFREFYDAFPKHRDPDAARKAWARAIKRADPQAIIDGALRYAEERRGQDPTFTKYPATWLNAGSWLDAPAERGPKVSKATTSLAAWAARTGDDGQRAIGGGR